MSALLKPDVPAVDLTSARAAGAALRTFFRLADAWQLSVAEQTTLLGVARTTLYQWKQGKVAPLDRHLLERLSHLFGIYSSLQILFPASRRADEWLRKPNSAPLFQGHSRARPHARRPGRRSVRRAPVPRRAARRQGMSRRVAGEANRATRSAQASRGR